MEIEIGYSNRKLKLKFDDDVKVARFAPRKVDRAVIYDDFVTALDRSKLDSFRTIASPLVIVNDGFRNTPTALILGWLRDYDKALFDSCRFLVATGTHVYPTEEHFDKIFGELYPEVRARLSVHNCHDDSSMIVLGTDNFGQEAKINRLAADSEAILVISSVEPHYFAGYTGGRKSFFPGLADLATIARNHNLANSLEAAPLRLQGNPVAEHLDELITMFDLSCVLSIQTVLDVESKLAGLFVGDLNSTFEQGVQLADKIYAHAVAEPFDAVICSMESPLDKNLYQTQKGLENCQAVVKDGGNIILVSACDEGIGSKHFYDLAQQWDIVTNKPVDGIQRFGSHKLSRVLTTKKRIGVRLFTEMNHDEARRVFYDPVDDLDKFINDSKQSTQQYTVAVVDDAGSSVLKLRPDAAQ